MNTFIRQTRQRAYVISLTIPRLSTMASDRQRGITHARSDRWVIIFIIFMDPPAQSAGLKIKLIIIIIIII